ncbi:MAG: DUF2147 domain-containing protein [Flavobacterium sp.]|nr:MAG: DUF2147 domain-containing protein [Flavobacterium sp.]
MGNHIAWIMVSLFFSLSFGQNEIVGKWRTIDDETGKAISIVEIFESHGKIYGKVSEILDPKGRNRTCSLCNGEDKDKPILGLLVIKGLKKDGNEYTGGHILDPKHGKLYKCYITLEGKDRLKVRGYIGLSFFGRTQYWQRVR